MLFFLEYLTHNIARHHVFMKIPPRQVQLAEVGPRFEMKRELLDRYRHRSPLIQGCGVAYEIRQGTIEQTEAEREWVLAHYSRTAKKRSLLDGPAPRPTVVSVDGSGQNPKKRARR